jgi:hypothetical protein
MATNTPKLLDVLDAEIVEKIQPFFAPLGAQHFVGESSYDSWPAPSTLKSRSHKELDGRFFWWINRFVVKDVTFDICYGDREFLIETMLFYAGIKDRFAPWELLTASGISEPHVVSGEAWVLTPDFMVGIIDRLAIGIRQHWNILEKPQPKIIDRALVLRGKRMLFAKEEQRRRDRERAIVHASTAFHAGKYAEAKRLLEPFKSDVDLIPSALKILELAEKKIKKL